MAGMTDAERMIWAAAFANAMKSGLSPHGKLALAYEAVLGFRQVSSVGPVGSSESVAMLREIRGDDMPDVERFHWDLAAVAKHAGEIVASGLPPFTTSELLDAFYDAGAVRVRPPSKIDGTDDFDLDVPLRREPREDLRPMKHLGQDAMQTLKRNIRKAMLMNGVDSNRSDFVEDLVRAACGMDPEDR